MLRTLRSCHFTVVVVPVSPRRPKKAILRDCGVHLRYPASRPSHPQPSAFCLLLRQDSPDSQTRRARKPKLRIALDTILVSRHELGIFIVYPWVFTGAVVGVPRARGVCFLNTIVRWQFTNFTFPACRQVEVEYGTGGKKVTLAHVVWETY